MERSHFNATLGNIPPRPTFASGMIMLQVFKDILDIQFFIRVEG
jgi:hypothetical protein